MRWAFPYVPLELALPPLDHFESNQRFYCTDIIDRPSTWGGIIALVLYCILICVLYCRKEKIGLRPAHKWSKRIMCFLITLICLVAIEGHGTLLIWLTFPLFLFLYLFWFTLALCRYRKNAIPKRNYFYYGGLLLTWLAMFSYYVASKFYRLPASYPPHIAKVLRNLRRIELAEQMCMELRGAPAPLAQLFLLRAKTYTGKRFYLYHASLNFSTFSKLTSIKDLYDYLLSQQRAEHEYNNKTADSTGFIAYYFPRNWRFCTFSELTTLTELSVLIDDELRRGEKDGYKYILETNTPRKGLFICHAIPINYKKGAFSFLLFPLRLYARDSISIPYTITLGDKKGKFASPKDRVYDRLVPF